MDNSRGSIARTVPPPPEGELNGKQAQLPVLAPAARKAVGKTWLSPENEAFVQPVRRWLRRRFGARGKGAAATGASNGLPATGPADVVDAIPGPAYDPSDPGAASVEQRPMMEQAAAGDGSGTFEAQTQGVAAAAKVRTMVEALPGDGAYSENGHGGIDDFLPDSLKDVFDAKEYGNPRVKALLRGRDPVDVKELAKELDEFVKTVLADTGT